VAELDVFETVPEKSLNSIQEPDKQKSSVVEESFFQKFRTPFDKQKTEKTDKYDFASEKILLKQPKSNFVYGIFAVVFLVILVLFIIILGYLYKSNDIKSDDITPDDITLDDIKPIEQTYKKENNPSILSLQHNIKTLNNYIQKEEYQVALEEAKKINTLFETEFADNNTNNDNSQIYPLRIQHHNYLSEIYYRLNDPHKATTYSEKALRQAVDFYGKSALQTAKQYELMAFNLDNIGDFDKALNLRYNAIHIRLKYDDTQLDEGRLIADMNNLGEEYRTLGHLQESKEILLKAISRIEKKHGIDAPELIVVLNNLGLTHQENNDKTIGLAFLQQAYQLAYRHYGNDHELTTIITKNISRLRQIR
jgi:tetratricopeptide (TPR) repeat protein